jgi:hypothetical protein
MTFFNNKCHFSPCIYTHRLRYEGFHSSGIHLPRFQTQLSPYADKVPYTSPLFPPLPNTSHPETAPTSRDSTRKYVGKISSIEFQGVRAKPPSPPNKKAQDLKILGFLFSILAKLNQEVFS